MAGSSVRQGAIGKGPVAKGPVAVTLLTGIVAIGLFSLRFFAHSASGLEVVDLTPRAVNPGGPALCPWREPEADLQAFFPGASGYRTNTLIFSSLRPQITARLGPKVPLKENALRTYLALRGSELAGTILVHRASGEHGAIEIVVAVAPDGQVVGARLQRLREPEAVSAALTAPAWLRAFKGKTAGDAWQVGGDLPAVPADARKSAQAVAGTVRLVLVELAVTSEAAHKTRSGKS